MKTLIIIFAVIICGRANAQELGIDLKYGLTIGQTNHFKKNMFYSGTDLSFETKNRKGITFCIGTGIAMLKFNPSDSVYTSITLLNLPLSVRFYGLIFKSNEFYLQLGLSNNFFINNKEEIRGINGKRTARLSETSYNMGGFGTIGYKKQINAHYNIALSLTEQQDFIYGNSPRRGEFRTRTSSFSVTLIRKL